MEDGRQLKVLELVHRVVWGPWLLGFFLAAGLWYTLRSGGFQLWGVGIWWKATVGSFFGEKERTVSGPVPAGPEETLHFICPHFSG